jgi:hypothetical protein
VLRLDAAFPFEWLRAFECRSVSNNPRLFAGESGVEPPQSKYGVLRLDAAFPFAYARNAEKFIFMLHCCHDFASMSPISK